MRIRHQSTFSATFSAAIGLIPRTLAAVALGPIIVLMSGCAGGSPEPTRGLDRADRVVRADLNDSRAASSLPDAEPGGRPPVLLNGAPITWAELTPLLSEAAGAQAIQELAVDRLVDEALERERIRVTNSDVERERQLLTRAVTGRGGSSQVVTDLRRLRGLGDTRFPATLERNAKLRALVAGTIRIDESDIQRAFAVNHGPKVRIRLIATSDEATAQRARTAVGNGAGVREQFIQQATMLSSDASARAGGVVEPFSLDDPSYPSGLREVLRRTAVGAVTPVIALDEGGFAIAYLESTAPGTGASLGQTRNALEQDLRLRAEREAMDRLARELIRSASVTVFDPSLGWSWRERGPGG